MRKYRGINKDTKQWVYGWYIKTHFAHYIVPKDYTVNWKVFIEVIPETVSQATGRKDKKGVEIYGGDKWKRGDFVAIIVFKDSQWKFETAPESKYIQYPYFHSNAATGEIIGNIHTTPNLLEQNNDSKNPR